MKKRSIILLVIVALLGCNEELDSVWESGNYGTIGVRNDFDIMYYSSSPEPTPLIIAMHPGGFFMGDKVYILPENSGFITEEQLRQNKIAYASINYYLLDELENEDRGVIHSLEDCLKFLRYIRDNKHRYNINPNKIILLGGSAGASAALWIGLQDNNISGMVCLSPQASLNLARWRSEIFSDKDQEYIFDEFMSIPKNIDLFNRYYLTLDSTGIEEYSAKYNLHFLDLIDPSDPEVYIRSQDVIDFWHHPFHNLTLKRKSDAVGHVCTLNSNESIIDFCIRKFQ